MSIEVTLAERGTRYGSFTDHARITQNVKRAMMDSPNWKKLSDSQREALEMLAHKVGRILNGDPNYIDSWHDIIGYTKLVEDELNEQVAKAVAAANAPPAFLTARTAQGGIGQAGPAVTVGGGKWDSCGK